MGCEEGAGIFPAKGVKEHFWTISGVFPTLPSTPKKIVAQIEKPVIKYIFIGFIVSIGFIVLIVFILFIDFIDYQVFIGFIVLIDSIYFIVKFKFNEMKLITFANRKGGCGKSTSAVLLASIFSNIFEDRVLLVDMDDQQSIGKQWTARHTDEGVGWDFLDLPSPMRTKDQFNMFREYIEETGKNYDYVLLDTAGRLSEGGQEHKVLEMSDAICVPIVPTGMTWADTMEYLSFVMRCSLKPETKVVTYLNQFVNNRKRCREVREALSEIVSQSELFHVLNNSLGFLEEFAAMPLLVTNTDTTARLQAYNWACEIKQTL